MGMGFSHPHLFNLKREVLNMAYQNKAYHEKIFVEQILAVGIERVYETDEGNKTYYCFDCMYKHRNTIILDIVNLNILLQPFNSIFWYAIRL
jgi:hypothetical protein